VDTRVLLVEDDFTVAEVVVDYLRHAGLEPRHAVDGQTALEIAAVWRPGLVLDLMLPGVSGWRCAAACGRAGTRGRRCR
jgi:two-component system response regulator BaeR